MTKLGCQLFLLYAFLLNSLGCNSSQEDKLNPGVVPQSINTMYTKSISAHPIDPSKVLLTTTDSDLIIYDVEKNDYQYVNKSKKEKYNIATGSWSRDGNKIAFVHEGNIYIVDVKTGEINQVTNDLDANFKLVWKNESEILFTQANDVTKRTGIYKVDIISSEKEEVLVGDDWYSVMGYIPAKEEMFYFNKSNAMDFSALFYKALATKTGITNIEKVITNSEDFMTEELFSVSEDGLYIVFYGFGEDETPNPNIYIANTKTRKTAEVERPKEGNIFDVVFNSDMSKLIYLVQQKSGAIEIIVKPITEKMLKRVS